MLGAVASWVVHERTARRWFRDAPTGGAPHRSGWIVSSARLNASRFSHSGIGRNLSSCDEAVGALDAALFPARFRGGRELDFERQSAAEGAEGLVLFAIAAAQDARDAVLPVVEHADPQERRQSARRRPRYRRKGRPDPRATRRARRSDRCSSDGRRTGAQRVATPATTSLTRREVELHLIAWDIERSHEGFFADDLASAIGNILAQRAFLISRSGSTNARSRLPCNRRYLRRSADQVVDV